jgi:Flp pilus assembly protein TadB
MIALLIFSVAAVVAFASRRGVRKRLGTVLRRPSPVPDGRRTRLLVAAVAGLAAAGLIGTWWGLSIGAAAAVATERFLRRREPSRVREERRAAAADLPLGADLLAAALRAGAPVERAAEAVADALGGPLGERLRRTARSLRLGAGPAEACAARTA